MIISLYKNKFVSKEFLTEIEISPINVIKFIIPEQPNPSSPLEAKIKNTDSESQYSLSNLSFKDGLSIYRYCRHFLQKKFERMDGNSHS